MSHTTEPSPPAGEADHVAPEVQEPEAPSEAPALRAERDQLDWAENQQLATRTQPHRLLFWVIISIITIAWAILLVAWLRR